MKVDYQKMYEDALEKAKTIHSLLKCSDDSKNYSYAETIKDIFPELRESDDERIRKSLIALIKEIKLQPLKRPEDWNGMLTWLEKQGEQKLCMIQWKGDNLKEVIGFTGKNKNFDKWFTSFEEYERYVHEHNNIFKLFNEDGSHYEVPVGAWIVKTPDGYNVASKAVLKQKPDNKVEPKFKVGDWVKAISSGNIFKILSVNDGLYRVLCYDGVEANYPIKDIDYDLEYWRIQDAKEGDVLYENDTKTILIFKSQICGWIKVYYDYWISKDKYTGGNNDNYGRLSEMKLMPATKEQRGLLFQKMKEAGYEWDAEKKELRTIEQPSWNEEDDSMIEGIKIAILDYYDKENADEIISWLESFKERVQPQPKYHWKPSEEQMEALNAINNIGELSYVEQSDLLVKLYNDLKKL